MVQCVHSCNSGTNGMGGHTAFELDLRPVYRKEFQASCYKPGQTPMALESIRPREEPPTIVLLNDMLSNDFLSIYDYNDRLVLPSTLAKKASFCNGQ